MQQTARNAWGFGLLTATSATLLVALTGCGAGAQTDPFDDEKVATSVAALDVGTSSSELDELGSVDPEQAASDLAARKTQGCRTRTLDTVKPNVVHITLAGCTGRFDRHVVDGHLVLTFSSNPDGSLHADTVSSDLSIDGRPFTRTVSADITLDANGRTVTRHSETTGTKQNGDSLARSGDEIVVTDKSTHCRTVNGTGHTIVAGTRNIESTITDFQTCEGADGDDLCPTGSIEHVNQAKAKTVLETFDGSPTVSIAISKPKGDRSTSWTLDCTSHSGH